MLMLSFVVHDPERTFAHPLTGLCLRYGRPSACQRDETTASQLNLLCKPRRSERSGVVSSNGGGIHGLSHTDESCSHRADRRAHRCRVRKCWRGAGVKRGDADPERAAPNILDTTPENQAPTFRNQNQVWPVRAIRRGDAVRPLPPHARSLSDLSFEAGGGHPIPPDLIAPPPPALVPLPQAGA